MRKKPHARSSVSCLPQTCFLLHNYLPKCIQAHRRWACWPFSPWQGRGTILQYAGTMQDRLDSINNSLAPLAIGVPIINTCSSGHCRASILIHGGFTAPPLDLRTYPWHFKMDWGLDMLASTSGLVHGSWMSLVSFSRCQQPVPGVQLIVCYQQGMCQVQSAVSTGKTGVLGTGDYTVGGQCARHDWLSAADAGFHAGVGNGQPVY